MERIVIPSTDFQIWTCLTINLTMEDFDSTSSESTSPRPGGARRVRGIPESPRNKLPRPLKVAVLLVVLVVRLVALLVALPVVRLVTPKKSSRIPIRGRRCSSFDTAGEVLPSVHY